MSVDRPPIWPGLGSKMDPVSAVMSCTPQWLRSMLASCLDCLAAMSGGSACVGVGCGGGVICGTTEGAAPAGLWRNMPASIDALLGGCMDIPVAAVGLHQLLLLDLLR